MSCVRGHVNLKFAVQLAISLSGLCHDRFVIYDSEGNKVAEQIYFQCRSKKLNCDYRGGT